MYTSIPATTAVTTNLTMSSISTSNLSLVVLAFGVVFLIYLVNRF